MKTRRQAKMAVALAAPQVLPDATPLATNISSARRHPPLLSQEWVLAAIGEHAASLLRTARRHSLCSDDAQDAYQRAIEIFLRRAPSLERATVAGWLHTVVKHEAHTVRDERQRLLHRSADDLDLQEASDLPTADEHVDRLDRLSYAAEALQRIKPAELRALVLKAEGHSYAEIEAISGWSYTKVNRLLSEGRRRLLDRYAEIESGAECARWSAVLSAMADGEASAKELIAIRPHLRSCRGCQSTLRVYRTAPADVQLLIPVAGLGLLAAAPARGGGLIGRIYELVAGGFYERATLSAAKLQAGLEAASAGKVAAVAATAVVVVGGGAAVIQQVPPPANQSPAARTAVAKT
ncbi:MAG: sigma-70 family RNA polymerase sigma factor, partial [Actinomycetota bacterium]